MIVESIKNEITEMHLHAYVDGFLSETDASKVEKYLEQNPEKANEIADWKEQNQGLNDLFSHQEAETRMRDFNLRDFNLRDFNLNVSVGKSVVFARTFRAAAIVALVVSGVASGWVARSVTQHQGVTLQISTVQNARAAHLLYASEPLYPVEVDADEVAQLVSWLSDRLGTELIAPDLSGSRYDLIVGRLIPLGNSPAAQFMYENVDGKRLTVYTSPGSEDKLSSFQFEQWDIVSSVYWRDQNLQYALVGEMDRSDLIAIAENVYNQLI